jgi:hypothetical protein
VGPMVAMIYRMMSQDLAKFGVVFFIFLMGFSQALKSNTKETVRFSSQKRLKISQRKFVFYLKTKL